MLTTQEQRNVLGKKVEELRKSKGMTQEELALKAGFKGRASINSIEKGHSGINVGRLPDLAKALGVEPNELLGNEKRTDSSIDSSLLVKLTKLDSKDRKLVEAIVDVLIQNKES